MFDTLLIVTLVLLASLCVCLLTLRLTINIKHLRHSLLILTDILKFRPLSPPFALPPLPPLFWPSCLLNLTKIPPPPSPGNWKSLKNNEKDFSFFSLKSFFYSKKVDFICFKKVLKNLWKMLFWYWLFWSCRKTAW